MIKWFVIGILILIALFDYALLVACSHMEDREQYQYERWRKERTMIYIDAEQLQDGLYNIKNGTIYKYRAKGGTVRAYKLTRRPQGEWIKDNLGTVICSECKRPRRDNRINHINFCNSCGARMKGADE